MGASVEVDGAGEKIGGDTGNLLARFPGNTPGAAPFLLSGHMDTVGPAEAIHPVVEGDVIRTDGTSVLGGDDKAGVVAILEAIRVLREGRIPHGDLEVVLTICEENGPAGGQALRHGPPPREAGPGAGRGRRLRADHARARGQSHDLHRAGPRPPTRASARSRG